MTDDTEAVVSAGAGAGAGAGSEEAADRVMGDHTEDGGAAACDAEVDVTPIQGPLDDSLADGEAPADDGALDTTTGNRARTNGAVARKTLREWTGRCCAMGTAPIIKLHISVHTPQRD
jgi:hypothetical protein